MFHHLRRHHPADHDPARLAAAAADTRRRVRCTIAAILIVTTCLVVGMLLAALHDSRTYAAGKSTDPRVDVDWRRSCGFAQVRIHVLPARHMLPRKVVARVYVDGWQVARSPLPPDGVLVVKPPLAPHSGRHTISVTLRERVHSGPELWSLRHVRTNCDVGGTDVAAVPAAAGSDWDKGHPRPQVFVDAEARCRRIDVKVLWNGVPTRARTGVRTVSEGRVDTVWQPAGKRFGAWSVHRVWPTPGGHRMTVLVNRGDGWHPRRTLETPSSCR